MKFSSFAVLAAVAPLASAFAPAAQPRALTSLKKSAYDFDGLDKIDFPKPEPVKVKEAPAKKEKKAKNAPEPAPAPAPVKAEKKQKKAKKVEEPPAPPAKVEPPKKEKKQKPAKKVAPTPDPIAAKIESLKPEPKAKAKRAPPAPKKAPTKSASTDSNALPLGVALGGAPLLLAPVLALGAGRDILSKTQARRAQIQQEIAEEEERKKQAALKADVDGGDLAKALVRTDEQKNEKCDAICVLPGLRGSDIMFLEIYRESPRGSGSVFVYFLILILFLMQPFTWNTFNVMNLIVFYLNSIRYISLIGISWSWWCRPCTHSCPWLGRYQRAIAPISSTNF